MSRHVRFSDDGSDREEAVRKAKEREAKRLREEKERKHFEELQEFARSAALDPGVSHQARQQIAEMMINHGMMAANVVSGNRCPHCKGFGYIEVAEFITRDIIGGPSEVVRGRTRRDMCWDCSGSGLKYR